MQRDRKMFWTNIKFHPWARPSDVSKTRESTRYHQLKNENLSLSPRKLSTAVKGLKFPGSSSNWVKISRQNLKFHWISLGWIHNTHSYTIVCLSKLSKWKHLEWNFGQREQEIYSNLNTQKGLKSFSVNTVFYLHFLKSQLKNDNLSLLLKK